MIDLFPASEDLPEPITREDAIFFLRRTTEAARAAVDEITTRSQKVLSEDEQIRLGHAGESLASLAIEITTWSD